MSDETLKAIKRIAAKEGFDLPEATEMLLAHSVRFYTIKHRIRARDSRPLTNLRLVSSPAS